MGMCFTRMPKMAFTCSSAGFPEQIVSALHGAIEESSSVTPSNMSVVGSAPLESGGGHPPQRTVLEILPKVFAGTPGLRVVVMPADSIERQIEFVERPRHQVGDR